MAHSVQECNEKIRENQRKLEEATKELKWWTDELTAAHREDAERTRKTT